MEREYCPYCNADLIGGKIPDDTAHHCTTTYWSRKIGVYDLHKDRTVVWKCPDCDGEWERKQD